MYLTAFPVGSPSRLPVFCLSEAVLDSQHECQWPTGVEDGKGSAMENETQEYAQDDDITSTETEKDWEIGHSADHE